MWILVYGAQSNENERVFTNTGKDRQTYNFVVLKKECHDMSSLTTQSLKRYEINIAKRYQ